MVRHELFGELEEVKLAATGEVLSFVERVCDSENSAVSSSSSSSLARPPAYPPACISACCSAGWLAGWLAVLLDWWDGCVCAHLVRTERKSLALEC